MLKGNDYISVWGDDRGIVEALTKYGFAKRSNRGDIVLYEYVGRKAAREALADARDSAAGFAPLEYTVEENMCPPELREGLRITIDRVSGQDRTVRVGKWYRLRGRYVLDDPRVKYVCLTARGPSESAAAAVDTGGGSFAVAVKPTEVREGTEDVLDLLMLGGEEGRDLGTRMCLRLKAVE
jgi:hypothetical protein